MGCSESKSGSTYFRDDGKQDQSGAYLLFSTDSGGVLTLKWCETTPPNAFAYFHPKKSVPDHKLKQNDGRLELMRGIGSSKKKMYEGVVHFIKEAVLYDGNFAQLDNQYFDIWFSKGTALQGLKLGEFVPISSFAAVVVVPHFYQFFEGVHNMPLNQFVDKGTRDGASWKFT